SGRKLVLVTGRELDELIAVFPAIDVFDKVVAENGALLYTPKPPVVRLLASPPPPEFAASLRLRGVTPLSCGRIIVATWQPHEQTVLSVIREQGLELEVIFNKGAGMVLPSGVNKATGLAAALAELGVEPDHVVGVGDAENDHSLLAACGLGVAVANAVPALKKRADLVTR
ncbi:HAD family phosphatase, partial [Salmonella enterica subsp. enterica serovar Enteritidis]|nr:HAD family phosphatase [Salmonella enterica subsp. enterica serovar Enteritidis]